MTWKATEECPPECAKKNDILNQFLRSFRVQSGEESSVYIKKWIVTSRASIFRLSDKNVQVYFSDKTE